MLVSIYYLSLAVYMLTHELSINRADNSHTLHSEQCKANSNSCAHDFKQTAARVSCADLVYSRVTP